MNGADLSAVVTEELRRLGQELQTDTAESWTQYWNTDKHGRAVDPKVENRCRDALLPRLNDRLQKYRVAGVAPEVQRHGATRADLVVLSHAGRTLPLEAKRHFHPDVWTAAATQLQVYASDVDADGFGIYLVFWFGCEFACPSRGEGLSTPTSASELESILAEGLPASIAATTRVVVLNVSRPTGTFDKPRPKRSGSRVGRGPATAT